MNDLRGFMYLKLRIEFFEFCNVYVNRPKDYSHY